MKLVMPRPFPFPPILVIVKYNTIESKIIIQEELIEEVL